MFDDEEVKTSLYGGQWYGTMTPDYREKTIEVDMHNDIEDIHKRGVFTFDEWNAFIDDRNNKVAEKERKDREEALDRELKKKCAELHTDRLAKCEWCDKYVASDPELPFFSEGDKYDHFYCGCGGWD